MHLGCEHEPQVGVRSEYVQFSPRLARPSELCMEFMPRLVAHLDWEFLAARGMWACLIRGSRSGEGRECVRCPFQLLLRSELFGASPLPLGTAPLPSEVCLLHRPRSGVYLVQELRQLHVGSLRPWSLRLDPAQVRTVSSLKRL